ncbi:MAG: fibronectin type III domain-containing protein, partial [Actinobacteria bacterium]|nr:fibronectin type III domain-containing protein [Actinomycetota bacterium]
PFLSNRERADIWANTFSSVFPNAQPRLGWACDACVMTREGAIDVNSASGTNIPAGLPLGFTTHVFGGTENFDSVRILPYGAVQIHDSSDTDFESGRIVSAFGNIAMSNGALQGNWSELPDYDFFYWGRTIYQGRVAFVITWVKIPTVEFRTLDSDIQIGEPIAGLEPTSVQLMLVSDSDSNDFETYMNVETSARAISDVDMIWNFDSIQSEGAQNLIVTPEPDFQPLFSGMYTFNGDLTLGLPTDALIESDLDTLVGVGRESCSTATCIASELLSNKFQSSVTGRYVVGFRDYIFYAEPPNQPLSPFRGFLAPAAPRSVQVSRTQADVAEVSWKAPKPWVLAQFNGSGSPLDGAQPVLGYRIEYAPNYHDGEGNATEYPVLNQSPLLASDLIASNDGGETRYSVSIPNLNENEQYTFRVYATYFGIDLPEPATDLAFESEIRGVPSLADERHDSELLIETAAEGNLLTAQGIASQIAGNISITNATVNGSSYVEGITSQSIGTFENGTDSIGIDNGIVLAPLLDARTFERGSGVIQIDSVSKKLTKFTSPQDRARYENIYTNFDTYLQSQKSWVPSGSESPYASVCRSDSTFSNFAEDRVCANGMTVLQFDVAPTADFLKFEYALAGTETGSALYSYPDGFGLFVGGIDQSHSCALVPQVN